ncbi:unnamed protein product [Callosobruchus maculatus]|uniref:DUF4371 domain-containing protein n=1 Tax=Callosobruchus maculatus TaxID=64391 RepID=A0A653D2B2_CALMS|nr:unnamed protein product [Callosobruchus maculatus]
MGVIVEHNSPMLLMDHLPKLLASSLPDSQIAKNINCARTKTTQIIHMLKNYAESSVVEKLRNQFFSIIIDETTDISSKKCLAILVRFLDASKDKIKDTLLALVEVENCTAGGLTQAIVDLLEKFEINKNNVIGFAADNASFMMGQFGGVQAKLKELVNPDIFVLACICHSLHLCASEACKKIPSEAEEFVQDIYNYICRSPKRLKVYEEFQAFIDLKPHKLLRLSQTRWLSLEAVVKRILEKWQALKLYFTSEVIEEKNFMRPRQILDKFERPETEIYLSFLCYILPLINKLNLEFQLNRSSLDSSDQWTSGSDFTDIVAIYHGLEKPKDCNEFLQYFVTEAVQLIRNGIIVDGTHFSVRLKAFICDTPAKKAILIHRGDDGRTWRMVGYREVER